MTKKNRCIDCKTYQILKGMKQTCHKTTYCRKGKKSVHLWDDRSIACRNFQKQGGMDLAEQLAEEIVMGVSRVAKWDMVEQIRRKGYDMDLIRQLTEQAILENLGAKYYWVKQEEAIQELNEAFGLEDPDMEESERDLVWELAIAIIDEWGSQESRKIVERAREKGLDKARIRQLTEQVIRGRFGERYSLIEQDIVQDLDEAFGQEDQERRG